MADLNFPEELKYARSDEWVRVDGDIVTIGISDFAQDQLNDIVYCEFSVNLNDEVGAGQAFASVESVKAASDIYSHVAGAVAELNRMIEDKPETVNADPYGDGWLIKVRVNGTPDLSRLMDATSYREYCKSR
jgi:glycine cleavage system H protein